MRDMAHRRPPKHCLSGMLLAIVHFGTAFASVERRPNTVVLPMKNNRITPSSIFAHPLWWTALALLVINDHVWKGAGVLPAALTGKLSDVAGLCVAPALLACLVHVRSKRGLFWCHLAVGLVFSLINTSAACALAFETHTHISPQAHHPNNPFRESSFAIHITRTLTLSTYPIHMEKTWLWYSRIAMVMY